MEELPRRTWHFLQSPKLFDISPCKCGNEDIQWSEYDKHLWCSECEIDFIHDIKDMGIFSGPIPLKAAEMMGIRFDRFNIERNCVEIFNTDNQTYKDKEDEAI